MDMPIEPQEIAYAENLLAQGDVDRALPLLEDLTQRVGAYAERECRATDERQWFSFADAFERLAYRRVERDPRALVQVALPFDRVYSALGLAYINRMDWEHARDALMQAVRWNPMCCAHRFALADVFSALGDAREFAALNASAIERASDARSLARAYAGMGIYFLSASAIEADDERDEADAEADMLAAEGCRRLAMRLCADEPRVALLSSRLDDEHPQLAQEADERVMDAVRAQGIETAPSAEIAVCLLMCASDAARAGDRNEAAHLTLRARDLIGTEACEALIKLIHESDAELAQERSASATDAAPDDAPTTRSVDGGEV